MELSPEVMDTCRDLGPAFLDFIEFVRENPEAQRRQSYRDLEDANPLSPYPLHSWPLLIGRAKHREIETTALGLSNLLRLLPCRLFGGDLRRLGEELGVPQPGLLELLFEEPNGLADALSRGDFIDTIDGFKCLEFNFGGNLGGLQCRFWADRYLATPVFQEFRLSRGLEVRFRDTARLLFEHVVSAARSRRNIGRRFRAGLVVGPEYTRPIMDAIRAFGDELLQGVGRVHGGLETELIVGHRSDCSLSTGRVELDGRPVDAVIELTPSPTPHDLYRAFKRGQVDLYNGPISDVMSNKLLLALLSELAETSQVLNAKEREFVRRHVPWTRRARRSTTAFRGSQIELDQNFLETHREEMVLKGVASARGEQVVVGRATTPEKWRQAVDEAFSGGWIVQERVDSRSYPGQQGEEGISVQNVVWGCFVFGSTYAGGFLRMMDRSRRGVINAARGATESIYFEVGD
ncbi:MAG: hypothetical protein ACOC92_00330 [bacterium]